MPTGMETPDACLTDSFRTFRYLMTLWTDGSWETSMRQCSESLWNAQARPTYPMSGNPHRNGGPHGRWKQDRHWDYKFKVLEFRKRLDAATGGEIWKYCEASCVLTALELLKEHRADLPRYLADERVRAALRTFPLSPRHPLVAAAVLYLRWRTR